MHLRESTGFATLSWQSSPRVSLQAAAGVIFGGTAQPDGSPARDVGTGGALSAGASWLGLYETATRPFVQLSGSVGVSTSSARTDDGTSHELTAVDFRFGGIVGKTLFKRLTLFAAARVFNGPVFWHLAGGDTVGGDAHHFAVGGGAILRLPGKLDLFAEGMGLGEQSVSLGAGISF